MKAATLNQLLIFHAIVAERSIRGAARRLELSAPSVSQALRQLEARLGVPLFRRNTRGMELTEAGELLADGTGTPLDTVERTLEAVREAGGEPSGRVGITVPRFVYQCYLRPMLAEFCLLHPGIVPEISVSDATVDLMREGHDLGIRFGHLLAPGVIALPLTAPLRDALFASPDYAKAHGLPAIPSDLAHHRLARYRFISSRRLSPLVLIEGGQPVEIDTTTALITNDTDAIVDAALDGLAIGRIVEALVAGHLAAGRLLPVLPEYWPEVPPLHIYFMRESQKLRRVRVLIDFLRERFSSSCHHGEDCA